MRKYRFSEIIFLVLLALFAQGKSSSLATSRTETNSNNTIAYVTTGNGMEILDVSDPTKPSMIGSYASYGEAFDAVVSGKYAYLSGSCIEVVDVSIPTSPTEVVENCWPSGKHYHVAVSGNYAYFSHESLRESGVNVFDISNPSTPQLAGRFFADNSTAQSLAVSGNYAYVGLGIDMYIVDISNPTQPTSVGSFTTPGHIIQDVQVVGSYAYIADEDGGLRVVDVSNPAKPIEVGIENSEWLNAVHVVGSYVYASGGYVTKSGLRVYDVSDPANPVKIGSYNIPERLSADVYMTGSYAYISSEYGSLRIVDVSDPTAPIEIGMYRTSLPLTSVVVQGGIPPSETWTLMYYIAGDNNLEPDADRYLRRLKEFRGNANYNIAILYDGNTEGDSVYCSITDTIICHLKGELNTGDPKTLINFVNWTRMNFPSTYVALTIAGHGNGLTGVAPDESSTGDCPGHTSDCLSVKELGTAFSTISQHNGKIDVLFMDACLMATIEAAYQLRNHVDYYIASQNIAYLGFESEDHLDSMYLNAITANYPPYDLAITIASNYHKFFTPQPPVAHTISVARLSQTSNLARKANTLSRLLKEQMSSIGNTVLRGQIAAQVQRFDSLDILPRGNNPLDELIDLYDFARLVKDIVSDQTVKDAAQEIMNAIKDDSNPENRYIVYEKHESGQSTDYVNYQLGHSHGVSIFFPSVPRSFYNGFNLDFASNTSWAPGSEVVAASDEVIEWGAMLVEYIKVTNPNAPDDPNPPLLIAPLAPPKKLYLPVIREDNRQLPHDNVCGRFLWIKPTIDTLPVLLSNDSNEPWIIDPFLFDDIFIEGGYAIIIPEIYEEWGPLGPYPSAKYLYSVSHIERVSSCKSATESPTATLVPPATNTPPLPTTIPVSPTFTPTLTNTPIPPTPTFTPKPNTPPIANEQNISMARDTTKDITLTASDIDNDTLTYSVVAAPAYGTLRGTAPHLTYTSNTGFIGGDNFTFKVNDGKIDSNIANISINVMPPPPTSLNIVEVSAPNINCIFDRDCTITVSDIASNFTPPSATGNAFLQSRTWPVGEAGTSGAGLYAYLYRIDLRNTTGVGTTSCVTKMNIDFGAITHLNYNDDSRTDDDIFVITQGGLGNVRPSSAEQANNIVSFQFAPPICVGASSNEGDSSFFFGLASTKPAKNVTASLIGTMGLTETLIARAPE